MIRTSVQWVYHKLVSYAQSTDRLFFLGLLLTFIVGWRFLQEGIFPGFDWRSHIARTSFLQYSFSNLNFNGWSMFWYSGMTPLDTYTPLFYYIATIFSLIFGGNPEFGVKLTIFLTFPIAFIATYNLCRTLLGSSLPSLIAALGYVFASPHYQWIVGIGSVTYSFGFALLPLTLFYLEKTVQRSTFKNLTATSLCYTGLILSNMPAAYIFTVLMPVYLMLRGILFKDLVHTSKILLKITILGVLLSSFWLLPYVYTVMIQPSAMMVPKEGRFFPYEIITLPDLFQFVPFKPLFWNWPIMLMLGGGLVGNLILVPGLLSFLFIKNRKLILYYILALWALFLTVGSTTEVYYNIPMILVMQFPRRFLIIDALLFSILTGFLAYGLQKRASNSLLYSRIKKMGAKPLIRIALSSLLVIYFFQASYFPVQKWSWESPEGDALGFLASKEGFFRTMTWNRVVSWSPMYTLKGSTDGWYDQASSDLYLRFVETVYAQYDPALIIRHQKAFNLLGVRYLVFYYTFDSMGKQYFEIHKEANAFPMVFENEEVAIFEVPDSRLIWVAGKSAYIEANNELEEAWKFYGIVTSPLYDPEELIVLRSDSYNNFNNLTVEPYSPDISGRRIGYEISSFDFNEVKIEVEIRVDEPAFVYFSARYYEGWTALVNGDPAQILIAEPDFMSVYLPTAGNFGIKLEYKPTYVKILSLIPTILALIIIIAYTLRLRHKYLSQDSEECFVSGSWQAINH